MYIHTKWITKLIITSPECLLVNMQNITCYDKAATDQLESTIPKSHIITDILIIFDNFITDPKHLMQGRHPI